MPGQILHNAHVALDGHASRAPKRLQMEAGADAPVYTCHVLLTRSEGCTDRTYLTLLHRSCRSWPQHTAFRERGMPGQWVHSALSAGSALKQCPQACCTCLAQAHRCTCATCCCQRVTSVAPPRIALARPCCIAEDAVVCTLRSGRARRASSVLPAAHSRAGCKQGRSAGAQTSGGAPAHSRHLLSACSHPSTIQDRTSQPLLCCSGRSWPHTAFRERSMPGQTFPQRTYSAGCTQGGALQRLRMPGEGPNTQWLPGEGFSGPQQSGRTLSVRAFSTCPRLSRSPARPLRGSQAPLPTPRVQLPSANWECSAP